jgi:hypothetical protein
MGLDPVALLAENLEAAVAPHGFRRFKPEGGGLPWISAWKRKTWNTNRGIALLALPPDVPHAGEYALDVRVRAGKAIGYIPFLYELGLQLVLSGPGAAEKGEGLERYVTKINNSTVLLQSLHLVDPASGASRSVRTWGQLVTGPFIDAIESGIARFREARSS